MYKGQIVSEYEVAPKWLLLTSEKTNTKKSLESQKSLEMENLPNIEKIPKLSHSLVEMAEKVKRQLTKHLKLKNKGHEKQIDGSLPLGCYVNEEIKVTRSQAQRVSDEVACEYPPSLQAAKSFFLGGGFPVCERVFDTSITVVVFFQMCRFFRQLIKQAAQNFWWIKSLQNVYLMFFWLMY